LKSVERHHKRANSLYIRH
jgi:hypothetical protein